MMIHSRRFLKTNLRVAIALTGLTVAACAPQYSAPQQTQSSNPSVTYKYRSDQELSQANQGAANYCGRYQSVPRSSNMGNDADGSRVVTFECIPANSQTAMPAQYPMATPAQYNPNVTYSYRTDQELLDASRNAQIYCMNNGSQQVVSNTVTNNVNGTRTVTSQCGPR
jgi:hypothetical protein